MRTWHRLALVAMVSSTLAVQAGAASAEKGAARPQKAGAAAKKKSGVRPSIKKLTFGVELQLTRGNLMEATAMMMDDTIIARSGSYNKKERKALKDTQKKVNKAWGKHVQRQLGGGIPAPFFQRAAEPEAAPQQRQGAPAPEAEDTRPMPGQYL